MFAYYVYFRQWTCASSSTMNGPHHIACRYAIRQGQSESRPSTLTSDLPINPSKARSRSRLAQVSELSTENLRARPRDSRLLARFSHWASSILQGTHTQFGLTRSAIGPRTLFARRSQAPSLLEGTPSRASWEPCRTEDAQAPAVCLFVLGRSLRYGHTIRSRGMLSHLLALRSCCLLVGPRFVCP